MMRVVSHGQGTQNDKRLRKSKLTLSAVEWGIFNMTTTICEDNSIFENPFPTHQEDFIVRFDACRTASSSVVSRV